MLDSTQKIVVNWQKALGKKQPNNPLKQLTSEPMINKPSK